MAACTVRTFNRVLMFLKDYKKITCSSDELLKVSTVLNLAPTSIRSTLCEMLNRGYVTKAEKHFTKEEKKLLGLGRGAYRQTTYTLISSDVDILKIEPKVSLDDYLSFEALDRVLFNMCFGKEKLTEVPQHTEIDWS